MPLGERERVALTGGPLNGEVREVYSNTQTFICLTEVGLKETYFRSKSDQQVFVYVGVDNE